jgi:hypothetical protein
MGDKTTDKSADKRIKVQKNNLPQRTRRHAEEILNKKYGIGGKNVSYNGD